MADQEAKLSQARNPIRVEEFEYKVRRLINDYVRPPKNGYKLERALWWMDRFREELKTMVRVADVHDLFKIYEIENVIQCATLCALASRERKESRWGLWHLRSDFPERNDRDWLKHIVLRKGENAQDVRISHRPIIKMEGRS
jgi:succinate dehydrogenase/fumarate reductase flavoprotein subunit